MARVSAARQKGIRGNVVARYCDVVTCTVWSNVVTCTAALIALCIELPSLSNAGCAQWQRIALESLASKQTHCSRSVPTCPSCTLLWFSLILSNTGMSEDRCCDEKYGNEKSIMIFQSITICCAVAPAGYHLNNLSRAISHKYTNTTTQIQMQL